MGALSRLVVCVWGVCLFVCLSVMHHCVNGVGCVLLT